MARDFGTSLALQKFKKTIEFHIRNYWQTQTSLIYSERWLETLTDGKLPKTLAAYPGDNKRPFKSIDISPEKFIANFKNLENAVKENSIINIITAFEVYLFDIVKRIFFLFPELLEESTMPFEANEISKAILHSNMRDWFSQRVTDKYLRNSTHLKMLHKIQSLAKCDLKVAHKDKIEEWNKWTYVRNAIVHNGREVSEDLCRVWPEKYSTTGEQLSFTDKDFIVVHGLALALAKIIDERVMVNHIKISDAQLLVREFFVKNGIDDPKELSVLLHQILKIKAKTQEIDSALGFQRRTNSAVEGWRFSHYNFTP
ncbi:hypothetical protein ACM46_10995 [Chryseobacterium angstadtii]|uniref:Uncharacterized protein n=1 Tax=Chryseobacterium angstadtii TaxID=558151 RepID=A0A0J7IFF0_9FLAO|nr:hypothetical protein [Chryseobacterium angstadtii]KMQ64754.1 hypothetical protein ACM46_10995 [Chryseobacterium angstadtii]